MHEVVEGQASLALTLGGYDGAEHAGVRLRVFPGAHRPQVLTGAFEKQVE